MMEKNLYDKIVELCKEKDISQRQLQRDLNIALGTVTRWKTQTPRIDTLQKVADYFGVTTDYLTGKSPYKNQDHMLQCWQEEHTDTVPDFTLPDGSIVEFENNDTITLHSTGGNASYVYVNSETRQIAEKIKEDDQLKRIMTYLEHMSKTKVDAVYNMVKAMNDDGSM